MNHAEIETDIAGGLGRQHDVSECMDNCMFQIETALLDFPDEEMANADPDKTSIVKRFVTNLLDIYSLTQQLARLFYGKKRQRLTPITASTTTDTRRQRTLSTHEKEDLFSHLHINVSEEGFDLYDGLDRYFDDVVEFNGVKKRMEVTVVDLPPLLQIQLQVSRLFCSCRVYELNLLFSERNLTGTRSRHISLKLM